MIGLSEQMHGISLVIHERMDSELDKYPARVSRSATLDGGAVIVHSGLSHGDRTLRIRADLSQTDAATLLTLHGAEALINIAMPDGFYSGAIERLDINKGQIDMTILIESKLSD
jgi:hypothetical protein